MKIRIDTYLNSKPVLQIFDVLLNEESIKLAKTKEALLKDLDINPSSFRRSRTEEQNIGNSIVLKLAKYFNLNTVDKIFLAELQELINDIYFDINYKVFENFEIYSRKLDEYLSKNYVVFPIVKLVKLFIDAFSFSEIEQMMKINDDVFLEISKYSLVFNDSLLVIFNLLKLVFCKELTNDLLTKKYNNGMSYSVIASRHRINKRYYESLYFAYKAKEMFIAENNLKRVLFINFTILNDLSLTDNFEEYYILAQEQMLTIRSFGIETKEYRGIIKHAVISALALKKYGKVIKLLDKSKKQTITEFAALVVAKFHKLGEGFDEWFNNEIESTKGIMEYYNVLSILVEFLKTKDKRVLNSLDDNKPLMASLINVLKKT